MLEEWEAPPVVEVRRLDADDETIEAQVIDMALHKVSRLAHRATLSGLGYSPDRLDELVIWVVGPPSAPLAGVARLAAERATSLLGLDPFTLGLALWDERPADLPAEGVTDGPLPAPASPLPILYLVAPVNEAGLTLDDRAALYEQTARFLVLHTCTPLRDAPAWIEQTSPSALLGTGDWGNGLGHASFGLTWLAWPGDVAQARAARWLAEAVIGRVMGDPSQSPDAEMLLREAALAPSLLNSRLTPLAVAKVVRLAACDVPPPPPWALLRPSDDADHPLLASLETMEGEWQTVLDECAPTWERLMETGIEEVIAQVRGWVSQALDAGGLSGARVSIEVLERRLGEWAAGAEQRLDEGQEDVSRMERNGRAVYAKLTALLAEMPRYRWRELVRLVRSPLRWVWLWARWREAQSLHARYVLLQAATLGTRVTVEQMKRACGVYWAAGSELQSVSRELDRLEHEVYGLFGASDEPPEWPQMPLLLGDDPGSLLAQLAERYLPHPEEQARESLAQWGPLSRWWVEGLPHPEAVKRWLMEQVSPLATISIWEWICCRYAEPEALRQWVDELVAQASPLWRWDPAALSEDERACLGSATVLLCAPDGSVPWDEWDEDESGVRALSLDRADRLAVVTLRWGIPGVRREA
jgi:hypothetical protein